MLRLLQVALAVTTLVFASSASAQKTEKRIALVIGNGAYQAEALPTSANDAGLIAQTLQAAGFDVVGARDLDQDTLRRTFRDFLDKASASGPDTVAFVYLSGYGVQLEGENYFVPVDAKIARDTDVSVEAVRMSDYIRPLAALKLKANVIVLDAARAHPFAKSGQSVASGLSLVEPDKGMLIAFNAAPGTVAPQEKGPYSAYAQALAEMIRTGGLPVGQVFDQVRLRVNEVTKGGEVPWNASKIDAPFVFFDRGPDAPPPAVSNEQVSSIRSKPIRDFDAQDAYVAALERDTLQGYLDFLAAYPRDPMATRIRAIVAARREAITWRRTRNVDTPQAYWSYLRRYLRGPHVSDARRRLAYLSAAFEPPRSFAVITYDVPPPLEEEVIYFRRPVLVFDDPDYGFFPPPPPPVFFLAPPPPEFVILAPPPPAFGIFILPVPDFIPVPAYYNPPAYVASPPPNVIYNNIHNTVVINNTSNTVTITNPSGQTQTVTPAQALAPQTASSASQPPTTAPATTPSGQATTSQTPAVSLGAAAVVGAAAGAALLAPSLPPSVAKKATLIQTQNPQANPAAKGPAGTPTPGATSLTPATQPAVTQSGQPGKPTQPAGKPAAQSLPGSNNSQPLPPINGKPSVPGQAQSPQTQSPTAAPSGLPAKPGQPGNKPAAQSLPGSSGQPLPPINGKPAVPTQPQPPQSKSAQPANPAGQQPAKPGQPPARDLPTASPTAPPAAKSSMPSPPATRTAPPPAVRPAPAPAVTRAPSPATRAAPPPVAARPAPPAGRPAPPPGARPAPPPVARPAPPPAARPAPPPPPLAARPASPPAARPAPPPAAAPKPCVLPNGQACPEKK
jgi:uncharacterized caspase-like protein